MSDQGDKGVVWCVGVEARNGNERWSTCRGQNGREEAGKEV